MDVRQWWSRTLRVATPRRTTVKQRVGAAALVILSAIATLLCVLVDGTHAARPLAEASGRLQSLAQADIDRARALRALWLNTEALLASSREAAAVGDYARALDLARKARREAWLARNQARLEATRYALSLQRDRLARDATVRLDALLAAHEGHAAYALARRLGVVRGE